MAADEWVWLRHPETDGVQHVPAAAAEVWARIGWEPTEEPPEPNPALAEYVPYPRPAEPAKPKKKAKSEVVDHEAEPNTDESETGTEKEMS